MDPVSLIVAALIAGAAAGAKDTAAAAVKDAYDSLKGLIRRRFRGRPDAAAELEQVERHAEDADQTSLRGHLQAAGADRDEEIIRAAQAVLEQADRAGARSGKYNIQITGGKGIAIGDAQTVTMNFNDND